MASKEAQQGLKSGHKRLKSRPGGVQEAFLRALTEQRCLSPRALAFECLFLKKGLKEFKIISRTAYVELKDWPVAYHGTDSSKLGPILEAGLRRPGELPSVQMVHGNAGAGPDGAIYASPSLWLASHPVYSTFLQIALDHWVQFVFKVRVRPGSFKVQPSTLSSSKHWDSSVRMDPHFLDNQALEWV